MQRTGVWGSVGVLLLLAVDSVGGALVIASGEAPTGAGVAMLVGAVAIAAVAVALYRSVVMRRWARRAVPELSQRPRAAAWSIVVGSLVGAGFIALSFGAAVSLGGFRIDGPAPFRLEDALGVAVLVIVSAVLEELVFRGVMMQAIETWLGWVPALLVTSLLFGLAHLGNPDASLQSGLAIAVEAGLPLGLLFLWRRDLWLTIGVHAGWNATESLLGIPTSGEAARGVLTVTPEGSALLNGGAFGLEASIVPVVLGLVLAVVVFLAWRATQRRTKLLLR
ncbi:CPBP family intramembrane glutamic endopeptidase [Curtobacterium poinsettiae]|uniref:CPBP family intramembrane glutamic endopeptidase n=1 Tax=Curtobacterium poinsettiae TaxID=159612 RepID=UPI00235E2A38|nr:CPBP family intramembrane glutamic endopeptidase [Curtobacterium flaccumfaciens]MDD1385992.1 CPBP family intramembrane metalloprotease [Curtobacterium flaccumfaciens pv. poinsettiae]